MMSECTECGQDWGIVQHHIEYESDTTIPVCRRCHGRIHNTQDHPLQPIDAVKGKTTISINARTRRRLQDLKDEYDSYDDLIQALLGIADETAMDEPPVDGVTTELKTDGHGYIELPFEIQNQLGIGMEKARLRVTVEVVDRQGEI